MFILGVIFFIIAENIKYDGDIFFILGENNLFQRSVGRFSVKRGKTFSGARENILKKH
jgi:hypothetical protein